MWTREYIIVSAFFVSVTIEIILAFLGYIMQAYVIVILFGICYVITIIYAYEIDSHLRLKQHKKYEWTNFTMTPLPKWLWSIK